MMKSNFLKVIDKMNVIRGEKKHGGVIKRHATLTFLKIDMRHGNPPSRAPYCNEATPGGTRGEETQGFTTETCEKSMLGR